MVKREQKMIFVYRCSTPGFFFPESLLLLILCHAFGNWIELDDHLLALPWLQSGASVAFFWTLLVRLEFMSFQFEAAFHAFIIKTKRATDAFIIKTKRAAVAFADMGAFYEFVKNELCGCVTKNQLLDKARRSLRRG